jgi:hypothetical protein
MILSMGVVCLPAFLTHFLLEFVIILLLIVAQQSFDLLGAVFHGGLHFARFVSAPSGFAG